LPIVEGTANFEVAVPEPVKGLEINPTGSSYYFAFLLCGKLLLKPTESCCLDEDSWILAFKAWAKFSVPG
jgi:hypothetical protein